MRSERAAHAVTVLSDMILQTIMQSVIIRFLKVGWLCVRKKTLLWSLLYGSFRIWFSFSLLAIVHAEAESLGLWGCTFTAFFLGQGLNQANEGASHQEVQWHSSHLLVWAFYTGLTHVKYTEW